MTAEKNLAPFTMSAIIGDQEFTHLISERARRLLQLAYLLSEKHSNFIDLTRPLIGDLFSQSVQLEELLDAYGARNNRRWSKFRSLTATIKLFSDACYKLLHIRHALPSYLLLPIDQDFAASTAQSIIDTGEILATTTHQFLTQASRLGLSIEADDITMEQFAEPLPAGRLDQDRAARKVKSASETITQLATAYLNLAAESDLLHIVERIEPSEYATCIPDPISEDNLRYLKFRFHSLQSLYDTHVCETEIECLDANLPVLRGHISVVYHLLEIATGLIHYYERHLNINTGDSSLRRKPVITPQTLLTLLMNYSVAYAGMYLNQGRSLCHVILRRYAEVGTVTVPVPCYRGLHVRPATLIARIVRHYGSDVKMELDGQSYDASTPMDLFRANEKINAQKRRWLLMEIGCLPLPTGNLNHEQIQTAITDIVSRLAKQGKLIFYQQPLRLSDEFTQEGILLEIITAEIIHLLATGQIDIKTDLTITFTGDKRVLSDLKLLAKSGYGEDRFGNNIALPKELAYLRR
ncbi:MAG: HPr family phosphocarrier protein [Phycisphaerales bacterium]|nr:HPr family phosphocarrier protein [Phycisphaerales bacterium]